MATILAIYLLIIPLLFVSVPLIIVLHELGHAIPAVLLTKGKVEMFIGSLGEKNNSYKIKLGVLEIWFKKNPLLWRKGMCKHLSVNTNLRTQIIYVAGGPFVSLLLSLASIVGLIQFASDTGWRTLFIYVSFYSLAVFYSSVMPRKNRQGAFKGRAVNNDGYILQKLFKLRRFQKEYDETIRCYSAKLYEESSRLSEFLLDNGVDYAPVFQRALSASCLAKNYERMQRICSKYESKFMLTSNDYCNSGMAKLLNNLYSEAKSDFEKSLALNPNNVYSLNNIGYNYILIKEFEKAIPFLDKAISLNPGFSAAFCNRGLAKIKTGDAVEGLYNIHKAMELDPSNAYTYRNIGIYCLDKGNYAEALSHFTKAKELDANTHLIDDLIRETGISLIKQTSDAKI